MPDPIKFRALNALPAYDANKIIAIQNDLDDTTKGWYGYIALTLNPTSPSDALLVTQKGIDDSVVHKTGDETITDTKTFERIKATDEISSEDDIVSGKTGVYDGRFIAFRNDGGAFTQVKANGKSVFPQGITSLPDPTVALDAMNKQYAEATYAHQFPKVTTYWFDLNGSDSTNDGTWDYQYLTMQKAIDTIKTDIPARSRTLQVSARAKTDYNFAEQLNLTSSDWINVYAPNCNYRINDAIIGGNNKVTFGTLERLSGIGNVLTKNGSGKSTFKADKFLNTISLSGGIFLDDGELDITVDEMTVAANTDTLKSANPATSNKTYRGKHRVTRGKIFTTSITDKDFWEGDYHHGDLNLNAASVMHFDYKEWDGKIAAAGINATLYVTCDKRLTNPQNDNFDSTAKIYITESEPPHIAMYSSVAAFLMPDATFTRVFYDTLDGSKYQIREGVPESLVSLTSIGTTATATVSANLYSILVNGETVVISGANEAPYNGTFVITLIGGNQFTYTMLSSTTSPATGSPAVSIKGLFTCDVNGFYTIIPSYALQLSAAGGSREIHVLVDDGSGFTRVRGDTESQQATSSDKQIISRSFDVFLRKNYKFCAQAYQNSGSGKTVYGGTTYKEETRIDVRKTSN